MNETKTMAKEGTIVNNPVAFILRDLFFERKTGILSLRQHETCKRIAFIGGQVVFVQSNIDAERLGQELLISHCVSSWDLELACTQLRRKKRLGDVLVAMGLLNAAELERCLLKLFKRILYSAFDWDTGNFTFEILKKIEIHDMPLIPPAPQLITEGIRLLDNPLRVKNAFIYSLDQFSYSEKVSYNDCSIQLLEHEKEILHALKKKTSYIELKNSISLDENLMQKSIYLLLSLGLIEKDNDKKSKQDFYGISRKKEILEFFDKLKKCNYYELLGVKSAASEVEIKEAYHSLKSAFTNDYMNRIFFSDIAEQISVILAELEKAAQILSYKLSREAYDQLISRKSSGYCENRKTRKISIPKVSSKLEAKQNAYSLFKKAQFAETEGATEDELIMLEQACRMDPANAFYVHKLGYALAFKHQRIIEGEKLLLRSLELEPHNAEAWYNLSQLYMRAHFPHKARMSLEKAISIDAHYRKYMPDAGEPQPVPGHIFKQKMIYIIIGLLLLFCLCLVFKKESAPPPFPPFLKIKY